MGLATLVLCAAGSCVVLYFIAGLVLFNPRSAEYVAGDDSSADDGWFDSVEDLLSPTGRELLQSSAQRVYALRSGSGELQGGALSARLVGPCPRAWFHALGHPHPRVDALMRPWVKCWLLIQNGHFAAHRSFVIPTLQIQKTEPGPMFMKWVHVFHVSWSDVGRGT
jgi:hypothetical protein